MSFSVLQKCVWASCVQVENVVNMNREIFLNRQALQINDRICCFSIPSDLMRLSAGRHHFFVHFLKRLILFFSLGVSFEHSMFPKEQQIRACKAKLFRSSSNWLLSMCFSTLDMQTVSKMNHLWQWNKTFPVGSLSNIHYRCGHSPFIPQIMWMTV